MICMAPLGCGGRRKRPAKFFLTICLIWHSINKSECKVELNFDNFSGRNWCVDAMCLIIFHYFTLGFIRVNETTWNAFTTGSFKWPSHISVWAVRMPAYDDFLSFVVIRWCTSAARREVVERALRARCHTHSYVGARCVRREILCMHKNSLRMPTYGPYAENTLCTLYANVPRVRGTVGVRWRNVHSTLTWVDTKCVHFTTEPSACW